MNIIIPFYYGFLIILLFQKAYATEPRTLETISSGIYKISAGKPDLFKPSELTNMLPLDNTIATLPEAALPFNPQDIAIIINERGVNINIPLGADEQLYGFGLQIGSFNQRGLKKRPIVNDYPLNDLGYSHAPMPYYVSTAGYAILINTLRYTTFYCGTQEKYENTNRVEVSKKLALSTHELYRTENNDKNGVLIDIPGASGIEIVIFTGPDMKTAIQRYNLFAGGGSLPPLWGLGIKYRAKADFGQSQVEDLCKYFRSNQIPCDVIGLEPGWQTHAYSCSFAWNTRLFPQPDSLIQNISAQNFKINLWEHAFVSPFSPMYQSLQKHAGDYLVWGGLVPDFADTNTQNIFADYHDTTFIKKGITGFKLDECDNSDLAKGNQTWGFPELSRFPSGVDGEKMHQAFGMLYQKTIFDRYRKNNIRTYLDVRSSNALASPYPSVLYSDTYNHEQYLQMISNAGFSGLLWSPEVRESHSSTELIRRTQTAILAAQTVFNAWYLQNPPWLQVDKEKNNNGIFMENHKETEIIIKKLLNRRMQLVPYLYYAFYQYKSKGIPPFRALVVDYPTDKNTFNIDNQFLIGEHILAAPITDDSMEREVYFPAGSWYNFNTNEKYEGGKSYTIKIKLDDLPIFIKSGTILPLAQPVEFISDTTKFNITCYLYGENVDTAYLYEDDGTSFNYEDSQYNIVRLDWNKATGKMTRLGNWKGKRFKIIDWTTIK